MQLSLPRRRAGWIISFFQKSRQEAVVSVSGSQEGLESHGRINFGPHSSSLSPAGSSGRFESVIKGYSRTLCQIMEAGKRAPHTQTPPQSATGQVPAFHLAALLRVRRWSRWSRLYGVWVPGAAQDAQDAHAEPRLRMHPSPSSVCSIDLKTRTSMCRSFRATGHSCGLRSKDEHISTGPALRAVPIAPCLHESSGGSPCSLERTGHAHSQLPR